MAKKSVKYNKLIYWLPRILSILFILFLTLFSLDIFSPGLSLQQIVIGLFMHNIPSLILLIILLISWKREIVGGIFFILAGFLMLIASSFESFIISAPALTIGILFILNYLNIRKKKGGEKDI
jgi:hypothetical protein